MNWDAFFELYGALPRGGPGSDAATLQAIRMLDPVPEHPRILDLGCGPGKQSLVLARELGGEVTALDLHAPYLERLERAARQQGLADRIRLRHADMNALDDPPGSYDLVWSEGALYILGFLEGLRRVGPLLRPSGTLAVTEPVWTAAEPPAEIRGFFEAEYPAIASIPDTLAKAGQAGLDPYAHFTLPPECWLEEYYAPMRRRIALLEPRAGTNPELREVLDDARREIGLYERHGSSYGYEFLLMRRPRSASTRDG